MNLRFDMKVAYLCPTFLPKVGGREIVEHKLASVVHADANIDVSVIVPYQYWREIRDKVPYRVLPIVTKSDRAHYKLRNYGRLASLAAGQLGFYHLKYGFTLWHVHTTYPSGGFAAHFLSKRRIPAILTCHGVDIRRVPEINYGVRLDPLLDAHIRKTLLLYPRIVAISQSIQQDLLECGVKPSQIVNIPNGVDIRRIQALQVDKMAVHRKLAIPPGYKVILSVGRNLPVKGFDLIPKIIKELLKSRNDFIWVLVGPDCDKLIDVAREAGVDTYLRALPSTGGLTSQLGSDVPPAELIEYYKSADLFVAMSRSEGFSLVLVEAMAAGLPLIATDVAGHRDIVNPQIGYLSAVNDPVGLANNIMHLLDKPDQLALLRENALAQSLQYDWSIIGKRYIEEYRALCQSINGSKN